MMPEANALSVEAQESSAEARSMREQVEALMNRHVTPALGDVAEQAEAALCDAREELRLQLGRVAQSVQQQPLTAIGLAALAGFVLARLTER